MPGSFFVIALYVYGNNEDGMEIESNYGDMEKSWE